jgi:allophanate hydrolase subunit 1
MSAPVVSLLGTTAALLDAPGPASLASQKRIWAVARAVESWPELREAVPGVNNLMLVFRHPPRDIVAFQDRLLTAWSDTPPITLEGQVIELPVVYGGDGGPHLADVLAHTGLGIDELIDRHTADARFRCCAVPAAPCRSAGRKPAFLLRLGPAAGTRSAALP